MSRDLFRFLHLISGQPELNMKSSDCWAHDLCATFHCLPILLLLFFLHLSQYFFFSTHFNLSPHFLHPSKPSHSVQPYSLHVLSETATHTAGPSASLLSGPRDHIMSWEPLFTLCTWFHVLVFFHKLLSHSLLNDMEKKVTLVCSKG